MQKKKKKFKTTTWQYNIKLLLSLTEEWWLNIKTLRSLVKLWQLPENRKLTRFALSLAVRTGPLLSAES